MASERRADQRTRRYGDAVIDRFTLQLRQRLEVLAAQGVDPVGLLGAADDLADRAIAAIPQAHAWAEHIGAFYDTPSLVTWLGVTRQALDMRIRHHSLLACMTADRKRVYPAFQFNPDGSTLRGLPEVLRIFDDTQADRWSVALWLTGPSPSLDGTSAAAWLGRGGDITSVTSLARDTAARWAA